MVFLEFLGALVILYLLTQVFLPFLMPRDFEVNWLFKKKKPLTDKIQRLAEKKGHLSNEILEAKDDLRKKAEEVDRDDKHLDALNN